MANLVPGVSGGTMILIMGLYDDFVSAVADATRLSFTRRNIVFLTIVATAALATIASLAGSLAGLVRDYPFAMYPLFIGLTLGGVPLLWRMMRPARGGSVAAVVAGVALMVAIAAAKPEDVKRSDVDNGQPGAAIESKYGLDLVAGVLGMSAMVLPGISGAYMLLILGRYEAVLTAVDQAKKYALSLGESGDLASLHVIIPVGIGAIISLIGFTNLLKWLLYHYEKPTIGLLLGIVIGSVFMLWPEANVGSPREYGIAGVMLLVGVGAALGLLHVGTRLEQKSHT